MTTNPYWYTHDHITGASYPRFHYRRTTYRNGKPIHEELVALFTTSRIVFLALLRLWNQAGMRQNLNHLTYTYCEVAQ